MTILSLLVPPNDSVPGKPVPSRFAKGADISWLTQMEASSYSFYDSTGTKNRLHADIKKPWHQFNPIKSLG